MADNDTDENGKTAEADIGGQDSQGNVDKIRDIIFGGQMRDYERRFAQLEQRMTAENKRLADALHARFEQLDQFMRAEFKLQADALQGEKKEREARLEDQTADLRDARKALEEKITDVDESLASAAQEIRNRLHQQGQELLSSLRGAQDEMSAALSGEAQSLRADKVEREDLAELLSEMALRLKREFDLPGRK